MNRIGRHPLPQTVTQAHSPCSHAAMQAAERCDGHAGGGAGLNLPFPRLVLLVFRGLALAWLEEPVLPEGLLALLAPEAASLCLVGAAVPPAGLDEAGGVALGCFLA